MLTYLNGYGIRTKVTNEADIKKWYEINNTLLSLDNDIFNDYIDIINAYVWEYRTTEKKRAYNRVYRIGKKIGYTVNELIMWYCIED